MLPLNIISCAIDARARRRCAKPRGEDARCEVVREICSEANAAHALLKMLCAHTFLSAIAPCVAAMSYAARQRERQDERGYGVAYVHGQQHAITGGAKAMRARYVAGRAATL